MNLLKHIPQHPFNKQYDHFDFSKANQIKIEQTYKIKKEEMEQADAIYKRAKWNLDTAVDIWKERKEEHNTANKQYLEAKRNEELQIAANRATIQSNAFGLGFGDVESLRTRAGDLEKEATEALGQVETRKGQLNKSKLTLQTKQNNYKKYLKLYNEYFKALNQTKKKEVDRIRKRTKQIEDAFFVDLKAQKRQKRNKDRNSLKKTDSLTLSAAFEEIHDSIRQVKETGTFEDGCAHTVPITRELEVLLMIEKGLRNNNKDQTISIRLRVPGYISSCIKLLLSAKNDKSILVDKVNMNSPCNEKYSHCLISLTILLCMHLNFKFINLKDCDCYTKANSYREEKFVQFNSLNETEKNMQFISKKAVYPHDFSYFAPYGFQDYLLKEHEPLIERCGDGYCDRERNIDEELGIVLGNNKKLNNKDRDTFILMEKKISTLYPNELRQFLSNILLSNNGILISNSELCQQLTCIGKTDVFCKQKELAFMHSSTDSLANQQSPPQLPPRMPVGPNPFAPSQSNGQLVQQGPIADPLLNRNPFNPSRSNGQLLQPRSKSFTMT